MAKRLTSEQKTLRKEAREWTFITRHEIFESIEGYPASPVQAGNYARFAANMAFKAHPELREAA